MYDIIMLFSVPQFLVGLFLLIQGIVILIQNPRSPLHRAFFIMQFPVFLWLTSMGIASYSTQDAKTALLLAKIGFLGVTCIPIVAYTFSIYYTERWNQKKIMYAGWIITALIATFINNPILVTGVTLYQWGYYISLGPLGFAVVALFACAMFAFTYNLFIQYKTAELKERRWRLMALISGSLAFLAAMDFLPSFGIPFPFPPPGFLFVGTLITLMGYFIIRHRLSDITIILGKTIGYVLLTAVLFLIYVSIFLTLSPPNENTRVFFTRALLFIGTLYGFAFLKNKSQSLIDRLFFREKINFQSEISEFNKELRNLTHPETLLTTIFIFLKEKLRIESSVVLIFQPQEMRWNVYKNDDILRIQTTEATISREFQKFFIEHPELLDIRDLTPESKTNSILAKINKLLQSYNGRLALPLAHHSAFIGFIIIGKHSSLKEYSLRETLALNHLSVPFSIAWGNAKLYERVQNAGKLKDDFVSISSHQLRTPLTVIKWSLSLLQNIFKPTDPEAQDLLNTMDSSVEQMTTTINQLLEIARIEGESKKILLAPVQINELLTQVRAIYGPGMDRKKQRCDMKLPENQISVMAYKEYLTTALSILFDNAVKYTPINGAITCAIEKLKDRRCAVIRISDTGIGIPQYAHAHIFTKFFRAKNALSLRPDGSGLGLAYAKMLIEKQGGEIWFHSAEEKGTTFFISMPLAKSKR